MASVMLKEKPVTDVGNEAAGGMRRELRRVTAIIEQFRAIDPEMQAQTMLTLLYTALEDDISIRELQDRIGIAPSSASRNVMALSKVRKPGVPGHDLVVSKEDPMERRRKQVSLTAKGKAFIHRLMEIASRR